MKPGIRPGTEKRTALLKMSTEKGISASIMAELTEPMRGKTEEEKGCIAEELLKQLQEA